MPWNLHEPFPGDYVWHGAADLERFIALAHGQGLLLLVRAGPYICAEWEFGGFPWWLGSPAVAGGGAMRLRSSDPRYLAHVDRWWAQLFARLRPWLYANGGPVVMMQVENEYGFCGAPCCTRLPACVCAWRVVRAPTRALPPPGTSPLSHPRIFAALQAPTRRTCATWWPPPATTWARSCSS